MLIGVPTEIKEQESRVGLTPASVKELINHGHSVIVEHNAGYGAGFDNSSYEHVGAKIAGIASEVFNDSEMIIKVKEPLLSEVEMLRDNQILFTYLHLASAAELTAALMKSKAVCIAYETVTDESNKLPLLAPMSAVAGRMSIQAGAHSLEKTQKGRGLLLGGAPGVNPANVLILGGGVVGENAADIATGMKAEVTILDKSEQRLKELQHKFGKLITDHLISDITLIELIKKCDLLVGGVLVPGANAPKIISKEMIGLMKRGSVIVDVAIDQGGCVATSKPTTHAHPTYLVDEVVHYCVTNMPGGVPMTSTLALNVATLPYVLKIAQQGYKKALLSDANFLEGLNVFKGQITYRAVAEDLGYEYVNPKNAIN